MTPAVVSGAAQTLSLFSNAKPHSSPRDEKGSNSQGASTDAALNGLSISADRVSISFRSRQELTDVMKEEAVIEGGLKEKVNREEADAASAENTSGAAAKVQFVYDQNGELSIRYMDNADRLVYQSPSKLMLQMKEAASKSAASVDTKV